MDGLQYSERHLSDCVSYSDADWTGDVGDRKSTSGYTAEAKNVALSRVAQEALWLQQLSDLSNKNDKKLWFLKTICLQFVCLRTSKCMEKPNILPSNISFMSWWKWDILN